MVGIVENGLVLVVVVVDTHSEQRPRLRPDDDVGSWIFFVFLSPKEEHRKCRDGGDDDDGVILRVGAFFGENDATSRPFFMIVAIILDIPSGMH